MSQYSIRELEKLSGIKAHTIRIWEKRYNLVSPQRTETNIRYYSDEDLKKLLNISILNKHGLKISKIANLKNEEIYNHVNSLSRESWSYESQIESILVSMIDLDEKKFEKILSKCIMQMGFENTIIKVIYPFFSRLGLLWQTGNVSPAQEHFISNLVRQKVIVAIDGVIPQEINNPKKFLLFLPDGELHELALLFIYFLIKKRGHKVLYLGQSIPLSDVHSVHALFGSNYLVTYFTSAIRYGELQSQIETMSGMFQDATLLIAGMQTDVLEGPRLSNVSKIQSPEQLLNLLENL
jgi:MerR family transcriptional regulator, light-induced transcriptional regulator